MPSLYQNLIQMSACKAAGCSVAPVTYSAATLDGSKAAFLNAEDPGLDADRLELISTKL